MSTAKTVTVDGSGKKVVDVEGERLEVTPLGAGCEVGRSCVIVRAGRSPRRGESKATTGSGCEGKGCGRGGRAIGGGATWRRL